MKALTGLVLAVAMSVGVASAGEFDSIVPGKTTIVFNTERKIARLPKVVNHKKYLVSRENGKKCEVDYTLFKYQSVVIKGGAQANIGFNASGQIPGFDFAIIAAAPYDQAEQVVIKCQPGLNLPQITDMLAEDGIELRDN